MRGGRSCLVILLAAWVLSLLPVAAFACSYRVVNPSVVVNVYSANPVIDHNHTRDQLRQIGPDLASSPYGNGPNVHVNGLETSQFDVAYNMAFNQEYRSDGSDNCFWYTGIIVNIVLHPLVYVASEIPENTCEYTEVLNHEYKHINVDFGAARDFQVILPVELGEFARNVGVIGPYTRFTAEQGRQLLQTRLRDAVHNLGDRMSVGREARQAKVDTLAEYERVAHACANSQGLL